MPRLIIEFNESELPSAAALINKLADLDGETPPEVKTAAPEPETSAEPDPDPPEVEVTKDQLRAALQAYQKKHDKKAALKILRKYAQSVNETTAADRAAIVAKLGVS